jgi:hypothetical protein
VGRTGLLGEGTEGLNHLDHLHQRMMKMVGGTSPWQNYQHPRGSYPVGRPWTEACPRLVSGGHRNRVVEVVDYEVKGVPVR